MKASRVVLIIGLLLLGLIGLFPPQKPRSSENVVEQREIVGSRAFLLSSAQIEAGRLLAEIVVVASVVGIASLVVDPARMALGHLDREHRRRQERQSTP